MTKKHSTINLLLRIILGIISLLVIIAGFIYKYWDEISPSNNNSNPQEAAQEENVLTKGGKRLK